MKLLLTSCGFTNKSIVIALSDLINTSFNKINLVFIPTAANIEEEDKGWLIDDLTNCKKIGFAEIDIVDIAALPEKIILSRFKRGHIIMFGGGNSYYLMDWIRKRKLNKTLPELLKDRVYVGISAGSMIATPHLILSQDKKLYYDYMKKEDIKEQALGLVDFLVRPHFNSPSFPNVNTNYLQKLADTTKEKTYAIDDQSAIKVDGKKIEIVSEGKWKIFN